MDDLVVVQFVQKKIKERKSLVLDILENNGVTSLEAYKQLMGELDALKLHSTGTLGPARTTGAYA